MIGTVQDSNPKLSDGQANAFPPTPESIPGRLKKLIAEMIHLAGIYVHDIYITNKVAWQRGSLFTEPGCLQVVIIAYL